MPQGCKCSCPIRVFLPPNFRDYRLNVLTGSFSVAGISTNTGHDGDTNDGDWAGPGNDVRNCHDMCLFDS